MKTRLFLPSSVIIFCPANRIIIGDELSHQLPGLHKICWIIAEQHIFTSLGEFAIGTKAIFIHACHVGRICAEVYTHGPAIWYAGRKPYSTPETIKSLDTNPKIKAGKAIGWNKVDGFFALSNDTQCRKDVLLTGELETVIGPGKYHI